MFILALLIMTAQATQVEATVVACPGGGGDVTIHRVISQNAAGGWDSDGARYSSAGQFREYEVSTCDTGLSLRAGDMGIGLESARLQTLEPLLARFRTSHPGQRLSELPPHERHAMAAQVYEALGRHEVAAELWMSASWLARDQAVGLFTGLDGPVAARLMLEAGGPELKKSLPDAVRKQVTFNLAVVAHRAGYPGRRDKLLAKVDKLKLTPDERKRVQRMRRWSGIELDYQKKAKAALIKTVAQSTGAAKWTATYRLADLSRRTGEAKPANSLYAVVAGAEEAPPTLVLLSQYFVAELAGKQPWLEERFQVLQP
ncbi:MAG: hypothetical protein AB8H79_19035 [Myxococcota bacterium]